MGTGDFSVAASPVEMSVDLRVSSLWLGRRRNIVALLFFNLFISFMDRINLSVAAPAIMKDFGWDSARMGVVLSSFQWTYCIFLLLWGWLADRLGARLVNGLSVTIWSIAEIASGAATGFGSMLATRWVLGSGEAAAFPTCAKVVRQWFPVNERGLATSIFNAGTFAAPAFSAPLIAWFVVKEGRRLSFLLTGLAGFLWVILWVTFFRVPSQCSWLSEEERAYILANTDSRGKVPLAPKGGLLLLMGRKTMWGLSISQGCCAYTMLLFLFWLPSYLVESRHMSLMRAGWFTSFPYMIAVVLGLAVGKLSDEVLTGEAVRQGRRRTLLIVFILLSAVVLLTNMVSNQYLLVLLISIALACISSSLSLNIALTNDLVWNPELVGTAIGFLILGGNIFGSLVPIVTGYIVKWTGSFDWAFYLAGVLLFAAALTSFLLTREPLSFEATDSA